jgi:polysaccharide biosynthesis protein PelD
MMKRYIFLLEIFIFYALISVANWFLFPHMLGFLDVDPHPFWLGILLFGFRYGVAAGFTSGLFSTMLFLSASWLSGERYRFEELNFYILPSFFIIFGMLIGSFTARNRAEINALKGDKERIQSNMDLLHEEVQTLEEVNRGLEKRIVTRMSTLITLYEGARRLEVVHLEDLFPSIVQFIAKTLGAEEAALYLKDEKGWKLNNKYGWKEFQRRPTLIKHNEGLTGIAGASQKIVSIRDYVGSKDKVGNLPEYMGDSVLAGPLLSGEKGDLIGVVSIQKIPFYSLNSASINLFNFLLNWASRSVGHARYIEKLREQEIIDPDLNVYSYKYFQNRLKQEFLRSKTYALPLSVGVVEMPQLEFIKRDKQMVAMLFLSRLLKESCRDMDVVARSEDGKFPFVILWVTTSEAKAVEMKEKIIHNFEKLDFEGFDIPLTINVGVSSYVPKIKDADELLMWAKERHHE